MRMQKKVAIASVIVIIVAVFNLLNLSISEKYEVQLEGLDVTKEQIPFAVERENDIAINKKITLSIIGFAILTICSISLIKKR